MSGVRSSLKKDRRSTSTNKSKGRSEVTENSFVTPEKMLDEAAYLVR